MDEQINQEQLKELLHYDPETGVFKWKIANSYRIKIGDVAGYINGSNGSGYTIITVFNKPYGAHRLAWLYTHGKFPEDQIDHINKDKTDNRLVNLRAVSNKENGKNKFIPTNNTSGHIGVVWDTKNNRWKVQVRGGSKAYHGSFECKSDAVARAKKVYKELGFHENHGKRITANGCAD
jgi:hypothetical protein